MSFAITIAFDVTCSDRPPREQQIAPRRLVRRGRGHDRHLAALVEIGVGVLDEHPAEHPPVIAFAGATAALLVDEDAHGLLAP